MVSGPNQHFEPVSPNVRDQFKAYRKLMKGDFKIGYKEANRLAEKNSFSGEKMTVELHYDGKGDVNANSSYYWEIDAHKTEDSRKVLHINPTSGKLEIRSIVMFSIH